jgi:hypothetical protein
MPRAQITQNTQIARISDDAEFVVVFETYGVSNVLRAA